MSEHDVICTGVEECRQLKGATHVVYYGDKEIHQRPEYCGGRYPHLYRSEEDKPFTCPFVNRQVEGKRIWERVKW